MGLFSKLFNKDDAAEQAAPHAAAQPSAPQVIARVLCPVPGELIDIAEVNDPAFASKAMGDGIAIKPAAGTLVAPVSGTVEALFPTGHALAIKGDDGVSVMLHIGIDTVDMKGEGFHALVAQGDRVEAAQPLIEFDLAKIAEAGFEATTMVIIAESTCGGSLKKHEAGTVALGDDVLWFA